LARSDIADLNHTVHLLALAVIPRVRITTLLADDTETGGLHATASAIRAHIAIANVASEHSLKRIGDFVLHGDFVNVTLKGCAVLHGNDWVWARFFVDGFGVGLDGAAGGSTQLAVGLVFVGAVQLLGGPIVDVVRVTTVTEQATHLQRRQTPSFTSWFDGSVNVNLRIISQW